MLLKSGFKVTNAGVEKSKRLGQKTLYLFAFMCITNFKNIQQVVWRGDLSKLPAHRRGHLDITTLNEVRAARECGRK